MGINMGYVKPVGDTFVSSSYEDHRRRNPPSKEPGTDYGCAYGTPVLAVGNGVIEGVKRDNGGASGRVIHLRLDDGNNVRYLHLSQLDVGQGTRVSAGQRIGLSGASANGRDRGVGAHLHVTLWEGKIWGKTVDFHAFAESAEQWPARKLYGEEWVKNIQRKLVRLGHKIGEPDGKDGPKTQAAVKHEQSWAPKNGYAKLTVDGVAGPATNGYLDWILPRLGK